MSSENTRGGSYQGHVKAGRPDSNTPSNAPAAGVSDLNPSPGTLGGARERPAAAKQPISAPPNDTALERKPSSDAKAALLRQRMPHGIGYNICDDD